MQITDLFDFRDDDGIRQLGRDPQIGRSPGRVQRIDPHGADGSGSRPDIHRRVDGGASLLLLVRPHRIFQVEDQQIRADMGRLVDGARFGSRNKEGGTDQAAHRWIKRLR